MLLYPVVVSSEAWSDTVGYIIDESNRKFLWSNLHSLSVRMNPVGLSRQKKLYRDIHNLPERVSIVSNLQTRVTIKIYVLEQASSCAFNTRSELSLQLTCQDEPRRVTQVGQTDKGIHRTSRTSEQVMSYAKDRDVACIVILFG